MNNLSTKYKGIVVFGAPGSGKTTLAKYFHKHFQGSKYAEAFPEIVEPAGLTKELPKKVHDFMDVILKYRDKKNYKGLAGCSRGRR